MRFGVFTAYDKSGNKIEIEIAANLDRTPPPVPNNLKAYIYNKERLKLMLTSAKNTNHIVISKYVENIQENKTYINDLSGSLFEIVKSIKNEKEVSEFLKILNSGKYSSGINLIRILF